MENNVKDPKHVETPFTSTTVKIVEHSQTPHQLQTPLPEPPKDKKISSAPTSNKKIEFTPRNQHVLGLKHIYAKYGRPDRYHPVNIDDRVYACNIAEYNGLGILVSCFDQYRHRRTCRRW
jgi:hypothetical protein